MRIGSVRTGRRTLPRAPLPGFDIALDSAGNLFLAGQVDRIGAVDTDVFVERIDSVDPAANQPPTVSLQNPFGGTATTVYADSPSGGTVNLYAVASDPDGDQLTYSWSGPFIGSPSIDGAFLAGRLPVGRQQVVTVTVDDGHGNIVSASLTVDVVGTPFVGATATPIDSALNGLVYNYAPVTITATAIGTGPNNAYLQTRLDRNPPIPSDLQAGSPPIYFDVSTDAALMQPPIQVCVDTRGMSFPIPGSVRLYHYRHFGQLAAWVDITSAGFPQGNQLCGQADTLGTFAIFYPQVPPTAVQTIAGNGVRMHSNDGPGGSPLDDYVDGPATSTALDYLHGGAYDRVNNRLFVSDGSYILRLNLNNNTIARVAGNGVIAPGSIDGPGGDPRDDLVEAGDAFNTYVGFPAEMAVSPAGDLVFFDRNTCRIRRLDQARRPIVRRRGQRRVRILGRRFLGGARVDLIRSDGVRRGRQSLPRRLAACAGPTNRRGDQRHLDRGRRRQFRHSRRRNTSAVDDRPANRDRVRFAGLPAARQRDASPAHFNRRHRYAREWRCRRNHQRYRRMQHQLPGAIQR